jgi:hypothetical protein
MYASPLCFPFFVTTGTHSSSEPFVTTFTVNEFAQTQDFMLGKIQDTQESQTAKMVMKK